MDTEDRWADSEARAAQLHEQADTATVMTIKQTNAMTLDEYRSIYGAAQDDPQLAAKPVGLFQHR